MPRPETAATPPDVTSSKPGRATGPPWAWLAWPDVLGFCRLDLRPASLWRVLAAVMMTSARYGGREARLSAGDLCRMTGLAERTVKGAVAELLARGLLVRVGRSGRFRVDLTVAASAPGADTPARRPDDRETDRGADTLALPKGRHVCPSPTSIYVSSSLSSFEKEGNRPSTFTEAQRRVISDVFAESSELLGSDVALLVMPDEDAARLGLTPPIDFGAACEIVGRAGDQRMARDFTRAVLALRSDERVQGREIC